MAHCTRHHRGNLALGNEAAAGFRIVVKARDHKTDVSAWAIMGCSRQLVQSVR